MRIRRLPIAISLALLLLSRPCLAYIEAAYTLGRIVNEATTIVIMKVEKVEPTRRQIIYRKIADLKGKHPTDLIKHNIGLDGFHPREWQTIMAETEIGRLAVMFYTGTASETCINNYWYQTYARGDWWDLIHGEPYLLRSYCGKVENLVTSVQEMMAGKEVVVPCMADGDKNALSLRAAKIQLLKASLKLIDYNEKRDFVGWGQQSFQRISTMPGFSHLGAIPRVDPIATGIAPADFDNTGQMGLCLFGQSKVALLRPAGKMMDEVPLPYAGGAHAAAWGDINGDGKLDLLLATPAGPRLFVNEGGLFRDVSEHLPAERYYNTTAATFIDGQIPGRQDILLANGFLGLRLYRNRMVATPITTQPTTRPSTQPSTLAIGSGAPWFEDVSTSVGLGPTGLASNVKGDGLVVGDVNNDGRMDFLYCAGNGVLALNTPRGFVEAKDSGIAFQAGGVKPAFGAFNGDKTQHLFVPQIGGGCKLFRNDGQGHFTDITAQSGDLAKLAYATSAVWIDLKKTGRPDLLVGCLRGTNRFFRNNGNGTFAEATEAIGLHQRIYNTRALCVFDMNKDGVPDLAFNNEGQDSVVLLGAGPEDQ